MPTLDESLDTLLDGGPLTEDLRVLDEAIAAGPTTGPWFGPIISDQWPPGWIAVCQSYEDDPDEHVPGAYFVTTGHTMTVEEGQPVVDPQCKQRHVDARYIATASPDRVARVVSRQRQLEQAVVAQASTARTQKRYIADMEDTLRQITKAVGLDPLAPNADKLIETIQALAQQAASTRAG